MDTVMVPLGALIISLATLILTGLSMRRGAIRSYMADLESRISLLESKLGDCEKNRVELRQREIELVTEIVKLRSV